MSILDLDHVVATVEIASDRAFAVEGSNLVRLIDEVRREFFSRGPYQIFAGGCRQPNSIRVVALDVYEALSPDAQLGVIADLIPNCEFVLRRPLEAIFEAADSPAACLTDLVCEVVWQALCDDPAVQLEDDSRLAAAD